MKNVIIKFVEKNDNKLPFEEVVKLLCGVNSSFINQNEYYNNPFFGSLPRNSFHEVRTAIQDLIKDNLLSINEEKLVIKSHDEEPKLINNNLEIGSTIEPEIVNKPKQLEYIDNETPLLSPNLLKELKKIKSLYNKNKAFPLLDPKLTKELKEYEKKPIKIDNLSYIEKNIIEALNNNKNIFDKTSLSFFLRKGKNIKSALNTKLANSLKDEKRKCVIQTINQLVDKSVIIVDKKDNLLKLNKEVYKQDFSYSISTKKDSENNEIAFNVDEYLKENLDKIKALNKFEKYEFVEFLPIKELSKTNYDKLVYIANLLKIPFLNIFEILTPVPNKNAYLSTGEDYSFFLHKKSQNLINKKILLLCNLPLKDWSKEKTIRMIDLLNPKKVYFYE